MPPMLPSAFTTWRSASPSSTSPASIRSRGLGSCVSSSSSKSKKSASSPQLGSTSRDKESSSSSENIPRTYSSSSSAIFRRRRSSASRFSSDTDDPLPATRFPVDPPFGEAWPPVTLPLRCWASSRLARTDASCRRLLSVCTSLKVGALLDAGLDDPLLARVPPFLLAPPSFVPLEALCFRHAIVGGLRKAVSSSFPSTCCIKKSLRDSDEKTPLCALAPRV
mmetsp:Transcript_18899/g.57107  ORF Transcript_18899/g.57107 Transcript_18899/m.57107 type:complete len:222 (-) Transcript_18899:698-1363(-)